MGINEFISSIFSNWKRKREVDDVGTVKKAKTVNDYVLTPAGKEGNIEKFKRTVYYVGEELVGTESRQMEYKEGGCLFKKDVLIHLVQRYACAFLNSEGGCLLAGVNDRGIVRGVYVTQKDWDMIVDTINAELGKFRPFVPASLYAYKKYPVLRSNSENKCSSSNLCVVEISFQKGTDTLYESGRHEVYLRRDGGVQGPLRPLDIKNLVIANYNLMLKDRKVVRDKEDRLKKKNIVRITIDD